MAPMHNPSVADTNPKRICFDDDFRDFNKVK